MIQGKIIICVSNEILLEYREILAQKNGTEVAENVINFLTISPFTEKVEIFYHFHLIQGDEDDNKFVDCAISSNALCLVSNDSHFNILKTIPFPKVTLLSLASFEALYKEYLISDIK